MTKNEELLKELRVRITSVADDLDRMRSKLEDLVEELDSITDRVDDMLPSEDDDECDGDCDSCRLFTDEEIESIAKVSTQIVKDILAQITDPE